MEHTVQTTTKHVLTLDDDEATTLGEFLLHIIDTSPGMVEPLRDLLCEVADHLNGVD
jgi:hypothetical protein